MQVRKPATGTATTKLPFIVGGLSKLSLPFFSVYEVYVYVYVYVYEELLS
jgi:hypothetical protein